MKLLPAAEYGMYVRHVYANLRNHGCKVLAIISILDNFSIYYEKDCSKENMD